MAKITAQGEILEGGGDAVTLLYKVAKIVFGADANGIVTIPDTDASAIVGIVGTNLVDEIVAKTTTV